MTPPEAITRCPDAPDPPALPLLPDGQTVPRQAVQARDRATASFILSLSTAHQLCKANSTALRQFFGFEQAKPIAAASSPARTTR